MRRPKDAQPWDAIFRCEGRVFEAAAPVVHHVADVLKQHGCRRVVDLGCGSGRHTVFLTQRGFEVVGVDNAPAGLRLSRQWLAQEGLPARLVLADVRRPLPLRTGMCDALISTQVIHHARLATVRGTAREITRLLRPGGLLFVSVASRMDPGQPCVEVEPRTCVPTSGSEAGLPHHLFSPQGLAALFPGFEVMELYEIGESILTLLAVRRPDQPGPRPLSGRPLSTA